MIIRLNAEKRMFVGRNRQPTMPRSQRERYGDLNIDIRALRERAQKLYYSVRDHGPYTLAEFGKLDVETLRLDCETLAKVSMESLRDALLQLKNRIESLVQYAIPEGNSPTRDDLRVAQLQERSAQDLNAQISIVWHVLCEEWGS
jgi:hypothetical protein